MKKALIFVLICSSLITVVKAQNNYEEVLTKEFFKTFESSPVKAYSDLFKNNKFIKEADIETIKIKFQQTLSDVGKYYGYEELTTKYAGSCLMLKTFIVKFERQPLRFKFLIYKPDNTWSLNNFSYDASIDDELEEASKAYRFKVNNF